MLSRHLLTMTYFGFWNSLSELGSLQTVVTLIVEVVTKVTCVCSNKFACLQDSIQLGLLVRHH